MGYAHTTILIYGVRLNPEESYKVWELIKDKENIDTGDIEIIPKEEIQKDPWFDRNDIQYYTERYKPVLRSDGSDSRVDSNMYDEGFEHIFCLEIASNGYGCDDDILSYSSDNSVLTKSKTLFDEYLRNILVDCGITRVPQDRFYLVGQIH